jgi:hypothetical protein
MLANDKSVNFGGKCPASGCVDMAHICKGFCACHIATKTDPRQMQQPWQHNTLAQYLLFLKTLIHLLDLAGRLADLRVQRCARANR